MRDLENVDAENDQAHPRIENRSGELRSQKDAVGVDVHRLQADGLAVTQHLDQQLRLEQRFAAEREPALGLGRLLRDLVRAAFPKRKRHPPLGALHLRVMTHRAGEIAVGADFHREAGRSCDDQGVVGQSHGLSRCQPRAKRLLRQNAPRGGHNRGPDFGGRQLHGCPI